MAYASEIRDAVLQYAIQGRLTEQLDSDSSTDTLADIIAIDKQALIKHKSARNDKDFPTISDDEIPFEIPSNWKWMRVGEIGIYKKGPFGSSLTKSIFIPKSDSAVKVYEQKNAIQKDASLGTYYISRSYYEEKMQGFALEPGDIIVSCAGTIGETYVLPASMEMGIMNQALMRMNISEHINLEYFLIYFDHVLKINAQRSSQGTAIKNIPAFEIFKKMLFPVPPIEEQQRIVDRVNVLMGKLDEFSEIEQQLIALKANFPADMRGAILQAAMQGKLTEQLESDSSVEELIDTILTEKQKLIDEHKIKQEKPLPTITPDEVPFDIPESWSWVRWGNLSNSIQYGYNAPAQTKGRIRMVRISDIQNNEVNWSSVPFCEISESEIDTYRLNDNDILFARTGGTVGKSYLVTNMTEDAVYAGYLIRSNYNKRLCPQYLKYFMESPLYWLQLQNGTTTMAQPNCNGKTLGKMLIPIPPIEEQQRIVERLDALLPICDTLTE